MQATSTKQSSFSKWPEDIVYIGNSINILFFLVSFGCIASSISNHFEEVHVKGQRCHITSQRQQDNPLGCLCGSYLLYTVRPQHGPSYFSPPWTRLPEVPAVWLTTLYQPSVITRWDAPLENRDLRGDGGTGWQNSEHVTGKRRRKKEKGRKKPRNRTYRDAARQALQRPREHWVWVWTRQAVTSLPSLTATMTTRKQV